jgi:hypothetical protein
MRSSNKSRSRNKNQNQNRRQSTNVVNRVFDSSGPEGKVRGTPQQIVEKYQSLARDAQLSGDRVSAEAFQQHAEHYLRLLNAAMREQNQRREAHEAQQAQHAQRKENQQTHQNQNNDGGSEQPDTRAPDPQNTDQPDVVQAPLEVAQDAVDTGLVETPEGKPKPRRKRPPKPAAKPELKSEAQPEQITQPEPTNQPGQSGQAAE